MDLGKQDKDIAGKIESAIKKVVAKSAFILGEDVGLFEKEFAKYCNVKYGVGMGNGTEALFISLLALGVGKGDEVITTANTFIATALAISFTGARPVFVDADPVTYNIDVGKIEKAITKKTRVILPVHLYGQPADMDPIRKIAKKHKLKILEDASQAHGAEYKGKRVGGFSDIAAFSLYPGKNLGAYGDAGISITKDKGLYDKLCLLRDYGRVSKYEHLIKGRNSRLDTLQAAVLRVKLKKLNAWTAARRKNAKAYNELFAKFRTKIITPAQAPRSKHVYHQYVVRVARRDKVVKELERRGVKVLVHYPIALPFQKAYKDAGCKRGDFPVSERLSREVISLPIYPGLARKEIEYVVRQITDIVGS